MLKAFHNRMKDDKGFTLIELMVVVLIIAILIAIAIPTFLGLRKRAQDRAAQSDLRNGLTAAKAFYTDQETYTGFTEAVAEATEPSLNFEAAGTSVTGVVDISTALNQEIALQIESESGASFCIAENTATPTVRGTDPAGGNLAAFAACDGAANW